VSREKAASLEQGARRAAVGAVNVGEQEQAQRLAIFEELMARRIAKEAARITEERVQEIC
jgi:hypothetical protein